MEGGGASREGKGTQRKRNTSDKACLYVAEGVLKKKKRKLKYNKKIQKSAIKSNKRKEKEKEKPRITIKKKK